MKTKKNITVFGATGRIGNELLKLLSSHQVSTTAVTRNKNKAMILPHIEWVEADMNDKENLRSAMRGSEIVFLVSSISRDFVTEQCNVIDVSKEAGVSHIVKLSSSAASAQSKLLIPKVHGEVEDRLMKSGLDYTIIRSTGMMQNWLGELAESVRHQRSFNESTGDGKRAYVDICDITEVAFKILTYPEKHINKTYLLTGGCAVNYYDVASTLTMTLGEPIRYFPISLAEAEKQMRAQGMPNPLIDTFLSYDEAQAKGETEIVSNHIQEILGKPPRTIEDFVKDHIVSFM